MIKGITPILVFSVSAAYFLFGVASSVWWFQHRPTLSYWIILCGNLLPAAGLFATGYCVVRLVRRYGEHFSTIAISVGAIGIGFVFLFIVNSLAARDRHFWVTSDIGKYKEYLKQDSAKWPDLLFHFPPEVPRECSCSSLFLGRQLDLTLFQLRCETDAHAAGGILDRYLPHAVYTQRGYDIADLLHIPYLVTRFRNEKNNGFAPLSHEFTLVVLRVGIRGQAKTEEWATNYSCGDAVNSTTNEVIYWATYPG